MIKNLKLSQRKTEQWFLVSLSDIDDMFFLKPYNKNMKNLHPTFTSEHDINATSRRSASYLVPIVDNATYR